MAELIPLLFIIAYVGGCWKTARIANDKGHTAYYVLVVSVLLTPIVGIPMALLLKDHRPVGKECPFCKEMIYKEAIVCKHCGSDLPEKP